MENFICKSFEITDGIVAGESGDIKEVSVLTFPEHQSYITNIRLINIFGKG